MVARSSRTYRLVLSQRGTDLFIECHCRLARLVQALIPYGLTLHVGLNLLDAAADRDIVAEVDTEKFREASGNQTFFVGTSSYLADLTARICTRLDKSAVPVERLPICKLYVVALILLNAAEDQQLLRAYDRACEEAPSHRAPVRQEAKQP